MGLKLILLRYFYEKREIYHLSNSVFTIALQVGHQIALKQIAQIQKLRQLLMSQMQAQNMYMAMLAQRDARSRAGIVQLFTKS